eukprot:TRINITY_DN8865_c0_g1::TRINITY_DN8865_c0_g1_i1::g.18997::m.18997 TRINITY_DN8865_c0_g1::TRINITY_DN8865_c0_g1_i1::g.18997  ORF type:complete len:109 (+),score=-2.87,DUF2781/PF10914.3/0.0023,Albumin_I/PF08027.6/0.056 TRINITY_DN8865_c0_g1_i1:687-1013(+)
MPPTRPSASRCVEFVWIRMTTVSSSVRLCSKSVDLHPHSLQSCASQSGTCSTGGTLRLLRLLRSWYFDRYRDFLFRKKEPHFLTAFSTILPSLTCGFLFQMIFEPSRA